MGKDKFNEILNKWKILEAEKKAIMSATKVYLPKATPPTKIQHDVRHVEKTILIEPLPKLKTVTPAPKPKITTKQNINVARPTAASINKTKTETIIKPSVDIKTKPIKVIAKEKVVDGSLDLKKNPSVKLTTKPVTKQSVTKTIVGTKPELIKQAENEDEPKSSSEAPIKKTTVKQEAISVKTTPSNKVLVKKSTTQPSIKQVGAGTISNKPAAKIIPKGKMTIISLQ